MTFSEKVKHCVHLSHFYSLYGRYIFLVVSINMPVLQSFIKHANLDAILLYKAVVTEILSKFYPLNVEQISAHCVQRRNLLNV